MGVLQEGTQQEDSIQVDDYNNFSSYLMDINIGQTWYNWDLNAAAISHINKTGLTKFCIRNRDRDYNNVTPTQQYQNIQIESMDLYVTYTEPPDVYEQSFGIDVDIISAPEVKGAWIQKMNVFFR